jgi:Na+/H+ antiporter NhaD/arsenite permease-like protein
MFTDEFIAIGTIRPIFIRIIERKRLNNMSIWTLMLIGAGLMVGLHVISIEEAFKAINLDVIIFPFGMFSIISALNWSGMYIAGKMLDMANSAHKLMDYFLVLTNPDISPMMD